VKIRVISAVVLAGLLWAGCGPSAQFPEARLTLPKEVRVRVGGRVVSVALEDYTLGSAIAEVHPLNESVATVERIYEVQAVLARSYAAAHLGRHRAEGFDLCDGVHCQLYEPARIRTSRFAAVARTAVQRTAGVILAYARRPAEALFHADCGGYTAAADAIWGGPAVPYLEPARDDPPAAAHRSWTRVVPVDELRSALNADSRSRVGATLGGLDVRQRDVSGRAIEVALGGAQAPVLRGEDLRAILNQRLGDKAIQSTRFTIRRSGRTYVFQGTGYGHGVGLCQLGAAARARRGEALDQIFATYFHGASLVKVQPTGPRP
jgi:stage II sporulation protein D